MKKYYILAAATIALAACNNDDNYVDQPVAAQISATIGQSAVSRVSDISWDAGDAIGITMGDRYLNVKYTTEAADGTFDGSPMYFKNKREQVNLTAYYPFKGPEGEFHNIIEASTSSSFQASGTQSDIDFLFARKENVTGEQPNVKFDFSHKMSQLVFVFKNGSGADVNKIATYTIEGLVLDGTFSPADGVCAVKEDSEAQSLSIDLSNVEVISEKAIAPLIVFPQSTANKTVMMKITDSEGQDYACNLSFENNLIEAGNSYKWTITVNKTGISVDASEIIDWTKTELDAGASSVLPKN